QIEHNGPWHWELTDAGDEVGIGLFGPTNNEHQWSVELRPGQTFTTAPASIVVAQGNRDAAFAALTDQRRALRETTAEAHLPVVFNDYMNTLMADPTTAKLLPLIDAAASLGAEIFCIDAGWYDDDGDWWDSVGDWQPSTTRFAGGLAQVIDHIRDRGMVPGLWLEPEVVGIASAAASRLPDGAFFRRGGHRIVEHRRHHLDVAHPAARRHLDQTVDRLVRDFGIGYLKLDYNITPGIGTDHPDGPGAGLLAHNRAYLAWLDTLRTRHPHLIIENCASGGMRTDYALLSRLDLQSTSDQQNPLRYAPIAAAAPASILPEQAAHWVYPQPGMSDEEIVFAVCTGLAGRPYLSGRVDLLDEQQRALVRAGVDWFKATRHNLARAQACWPLGLPDWEAGWVCLGLTTDDAMHLVVWRREGATPEVDLPLPTLRGRTLDACIAYPHPSTGWTTKWSADTATLHVRCTSEPPAARLFRLSIHG
ncbi:MAG: alpha-galactosidase, partial [Micrococcales bacterium]|nr:alpha-galactosidase [Micrococcales bacterium]